MYLKCIVHCLRVKMYDCKCLCCSKIGITQDQYRRIAKGLEDLAFTCSRCQREAMDVNDVADDDSIQHDVDVVDAVDDSTQDVVEEIVEDVSIVVDRSFLRAYKFQIIKKHSTYII